MRRNWILPCALLGGLSMAVSQMLIYQYAPIERNMGIVQKIFYTHLPLAWWSFVSFFVVCVAGFVYLRTRNRRWDALAGAAAEVGVVLSGLALISGSIWARAFLGCLVDLGPATDHDHDPVVPVCRLSRPSTGGHAPGSQGQSVRSGRHRSLSGCPARLSFRPAVAFHSSCRLRQQGGRA